jgi:hypothetical protein
LPLSDEIGFALAAALMLWHFFKFRRLASVPFSP